MSESLFHAFFDVIAVFLLNDVVRILRRDGANSNWLCSNSQTTEFFDVSEADSANVIIIIVVVVIIVDK